MQHMSHTIILKRYNLKTDYDYFKKKNDVEMLKSQPLIVILFAMLKPL